MSIARREMLRRTCVAALAWGAKGFSLSGCTAGTVGNNTSSVCTPGDKLLEALQICRNWISFNPPRPFNPGQTPASQSGLSSSLQMLSNEGWRGLVTYSLDPLQDLDQAPRIAKESGFAKVIAGLFISDESQFQRERSAALAQMQFIDGFVVGNEVLQRKVTGFSRQRLLDEISSLREATGLPATTSESINQYEQDAVLATVGDWVFPNIQPFVGGIRSTPEAVQDIRNKVSALRSLAAGRPVIVKEAWWPTDGENAANQINQQSFFQLLAANDVKFIWGEAFDQFWKSTSTAPYEGHFGLHTDTGQSKLLISSLRTTYIGSYA